MDILVSIPGGSTCHRDESPSYYFSTTSRRTKEYGNIPVLTEKNATRPSLGTGSGHGYTKSMAGSRPDDKFIQDSRRPGEIGDGT